MNAPGNRDDSLTSEAMLPIATVTNAPTIATRTSALRIRMRSAGSTAAPMAMTTETATLENAQLRRPPSLPDGESRSGKAAKYSTLNSVIASIPVRIARTFRRERTPKNANAPAITGATSFGDGSSTAGSCSTAGLCLPNGTYPNYPPLNIANWSAAGSGAVFPVAFGTYTLAVSDSRFPQVNQQPQYVIEALCTPDFTTSLGGAGCPKYYYRITARGFGGNATTQTTLQMVVRL